MSYITNFKPSNFLDFKNMKIFKNKNKNKLISRNFFLFLLLLKYTSFNSNFLTVSIFIKPFYKKFITILRAPYRHKLSRHQFILSRYYLVYSIKIKTTTPNFTQNLEIIHFLKKIKRFYVWFESNIVYQHRSQLMFNFLFSKNFSLIKFNKVN